MSREVWRKSSYSGQNGNCVEVAADPGREATPHAIAVRDSTDPRGPVLAFTPVQWRAFAARVKNGDFDLP